jgi:hypothetical protein
VTADHDGVPDTTRPVQVLLDRASASLERVRLRVHRGGRGSLDRTPVVEDVRDVSDGVRRERCGDSQRQVPVLTAVVLASEAANRAKHLRPEDGEVADVVLAEQQRRVPVGLEVVTEATAVLVDLVFVRVHVCEAGVLIEGAHRKEQRMRAQQIVVVEERDQLALGALERGVRRRGDAAVPPTPADLDALVARGVLRKRSPDVRGGRRIVRDAELPVLVHLISNRVERLAEDALRRIENRHEDRHERPICEPACEQTHRRDVRLVQRVVFVDPRLVGLACLHLGSGPSGVNRRAALPQLARQLERDRPPQPLRQPPAERPGDTTRRRDAAQRRRHPPGGRGAYVLEVRPRPPGVVEGIEGDSTTFAERAAELFHEPLLAGEPLAKRLHRRFLDRLRRVDDVYPGPARQRSHSLIILDGRTAASASA